MMDVFDDIKNVFSKGPSDTEKAIYTLLSSEEGKIFLEWLRKRTIEKQIGYGVDDGVQTAILTARELGRNDVYHEITQLLIKVKKYANRIASE